MSLPRSAKHTLASKGAGLILASGSPRRKELLASLLVDSFQVDAQDIDETPRKGELPRVYVRRIVHEKAEAACFKNQNLQGKNAENLGSEKHQAKPEELEKLKKQLEKKTKPKVIKKQKTTKIDAKKEKLW